MTSHENDTTRDSKSTHNRSYLRRWWRQGPATSALTLLLMPGMIVLFVILLLCALTAFIGR